MGCQLHSFKGGYLWEGSPLDRNYCTFRTEVSFNHIADSELLLNLRRNLLLGGGDGNSYKEMFHASGIVGLALVVKTLQNILMMYNATMLLVALLTFYFFLTADVKMCWLLKCNLLICWTH